MIAISKLNDLTGNKYGRLTVISRAENKNKSTMWLCKCDCGNEKITYASSLKKGLTKSCGCYARKVISELKTKDISGETINGVKILKMVEAPNNTKKKTTYYECLCNCGKVFITSRGTLINGNTKSCGCLKSKSSHDRFFKDITGNRYGRLVAISFSHISNNKRTMWNCVCDCGEMVVVCSGNLQSGVTKSCGCLSKENIRTVSITHGKSNSRLYRVYNHMKGRCLNKSDANYNSYGGRGIIICDEWLGENGFINFYNWAISNGYSEELSIDRIDNNGNYEPNNCRWVSDVIQCNNRRTNRFLTAFGKKQTIAEWSRETGINRATIVYRMNKGYVGERVLRSVDNEV